MYHFGLFSRSFCRSLKLGVLLLYNFLRSKGCTVFRSTPRFIAKYKRHLVWHNQKNNVPWKSSRDINMTSFGVQNAKRGLHLFEDATLIFQTISEFLTCRNNAWAAPRTPCRDGLRYPPSVQKILILLKKFTHLSILFQTKVVHLLRSCVQF